MIYIKMVKNNGGRDDMVILGIDTSSIASSVALFTPNGVLSQDLVINNKPHSEGIMIRIDNLLREQRLQRGDLSAVCVCVGPGSFTGIRVGIATAKAICIGLNVPLLSFNSLELLAVNLYGVQGQILAILDARMNEAYACVYNAEIDPVITPETVKYGQIHSLIKDSNTICVGDTHLLEGTSKLKCALPHQNIKNATGMCSLFCLRGCKLVYDKDFINNCEPFYIRSATAQVSIKKGRKVSGK